MKDYWESVESIARDVIESNGIDEDTWHDSIHESVDGNSWIIYYSENEDVLEATDNEPDNSDVASMCDPKGDWRSMRQTAAYLAMESDVFQKCRELIDEYTPTYFKIQYSTLDFLKVANEEIEDWKFDTLDEAEEILDKFLVECKIIAFNENDEEINIDIGLL